ncbi:MAG TPA: hypothetical protein P5137_14285, partial [Candidatus Brocadiia bacterium]|nr:hypothetical protein [Candidatus Brocadiia bacterium]
LEELAACPARILFIHGSKDPEGMAGREHFMDFYQRRRLAADWHLVEGANHSYYSLAWENEIVERSLRFFASSSPNLAARGAPRS